MNKIGIIGHGAFGRLLAELIAPYAQVIVHDKRPIDSSQLPANVLAGTMEDVARCETIIVAVDLSGFEQVCKELRPHVKPTTVVMDTCSVKVLPTKIMQDVLLGRCKLLATHPLFGPQSVATNHGAAELKLVWHEIAGGPFPKLERLFGAQLGLKIIRMAPFDHDKEMAWIHGLTFFVGRGLVNTTIPKLTLDTGYYNRLLDLRDLEAQHSQELFNTVERGNPFAAEVRRSFLQTLEELELEIRKEHI